MMNSDRGAEVRDVVIYAGGFRLPAGAASAQRCLGNARLLRSIGYRPVVLGKLSAEMASAGDGRALFDGIELREIRRSDRRANYEIFAAPVLELVNEVGAERVHSVLLYNYPAFGLAAVLRACRKLGVPAIVECTEWYGWEGAGVLRNMRRILESRWRATRLSHRAGNILCATKWFAARHPNGNVLALPFVMEASPGDGFAVDSWPAGAGVRRFIYSGSPGLGLSKDKLRDAISAFARMQQEGMAFRFVVVGLTQHQYLAAVPSHSDLLEALRGMVEFIGRVPREHAISLLRKADFSIFFRESNRTSQVGFPTKYAEATAFGIPVISNRTSDIGDYLFDGVNGLLVEELTPASVEAVLRRAVDMDKEDLDRMKDRMACDTSFTVDAWKERMRAFMDRVRPMP